MKTPSRYWLELQAESGEADAQVTLATMHLSEDEPRDFPEARRLYGLAAEQGHAEAQAILGSTKGFRSHSDFKDLCERFAIFRSWKFMNDGLLSQDNFKDMCIAIAQQVASAMLCR